MHYEEAYINGVFSYRNTPDGEWHPLKGARADIANGFYKMSDDERLRLMDQFCKHCGSTDTSCRCWDDS